MSYKNNNTLGQHGFFFFFGVVEDRDDPLQIGRVKVRCHGVHRDSDVEVPTAHLPWACVVTPTNGNESATSDLKIGCNVFGFFVDGEEMQVPMILGVLPGIVSAMVTGNAPKLPETAQEPSIGSSSLSGCATGKNRPTAVSKASGITGIPVIGNEPTDPYAAKYPYNHVTQSESGHVIELDDTPDIERVHIFHRSGSFVEMHPDGKVVIKSADDSFELSAKAKHVYATGNLNLVAGGTVNIYSQSNVNITPNDTVFVNGNVVASGDVIAGGISLKNHVHQGVHGTTSPPL